MIELLVNVACIASLLVFMFVIAVLLARKYHASKKVKIGRASTGIVLGSGGHTTEMIKLVSTLDINKFTPRTYFVANTDSFSMNKMIQFEKERQDYEVHVVPRAREVAQSYLSSAISTLRATLACIWPVCTMSADVLLVNGPGTCVPICVLFMIFHPAGKVIFVESICRVKTLSLSCQLLRRFATVTLVQWPELEEKFGDTKYIGKLV